MVDKTVGFAEPPPELEEHREVTRKREQEKLASNPFHRIPPELQYLQKRPPGPKPLPQPELQPVGAGSGVLSTTSSTRKEAIGDLRIMAIKDISVQNKQTEVNFSYPEVDLMLASNAILVSVKYSSLNSFDLAKANLYAWNLSDTRVGLGYEYVGTVSRVGRLVKGFAPGDKVWGVTCPTARHGALSTSVILVPGRDFVLAVDEALEQKLVNVDAELALDYDTKFAVTEDDSDQDKSQSKWPPLAQLCAFPVQYCRSKQALQYLKKLPLSNILINGADTLLGATLLQTLSSSLYPGDLTVVLVIREASSDYMTELVNRLSKDPTRTRRFHLVPYDMKNEDIVFPGEKVPVNYKKPEFFATEVMNALFGAAAPKEITAKTANQYKLDLVVDIVGSKRYLQKVGIRYERIQTLNIPFLANLAEPLTKVLGSAAEPFVAKIMKPKAQGSSFVSFCDYTLNPPSYSIDKQLPGTQSGGLWGMKWLQSIANSWLSTFNYYAEHQLQVKRSWLEEGLKLVVEGELQVRAQYMDWRKFRPFVAGLRRDDGKLLLEVEDF